jgi:AraC-like DNA-binding protein
MPKNAPQIPERDSSLSAAGLDPAVFRRMAARYRARWRLPLYAVAPDGTLLAGRPPCRQGGCDTCRAARGLAVSEALRWGEPAVEFCPRRRILWAVPVMRNQELLGGLVSEAEESRVFPADPAAAPLDVRGACADLLALAEEFNVTNAALLAAHRARHGQEQLRAEAIHAWKARGADDMREAWLREEPALIDAVRRGDAPEARAALNRVLVAIHFSAGRSLDVIKSYCMELAVTLSRAAAEAGGSPAALLGANYEQMAALSRLDSEEELLAWLIGLLQRVMDSLASRAAPDQPAQCARALRFMREHCGEMITRDDAARAAGVSPSHFSRIFKRHADRGFADLLNQMRVNRACELLARSGRELCLIALDCGFSDQSYFQKVFRRYTGQTPARYRASSRTE